MWSWNVRIFAAESPLTGAVGRLWVAMEIGESVRTINTVSIIEKLV